MRDYELMYIIAPNFGDDDACAQFAEQITTMIGNHGGTVNPASALQPISGRRRLAYAIRRESRDVTEGYYVLTQFSADPAQIHVIERDLKLAEPIMRHLITLAQASATKGAEEQ